MHKRFLLAESDGVVAIRPISADLAYGQGKSQWRKSQLYRDRDREKDIIFICVTIKVIKNAQSNNTEQLSRIRLPRSKKTSHSSAYWRIKWKLVITAIEHRTIKTTPVRQKKNY